MSKIPLTKFAGLVSAPGLLERNEASCIEALNWEFPAPGVMRKRRGWARQTGNAGGSIWALLTSRLMGTKLLAHVGTATKGNQLRYGDGSGALAAIATIDGAPLTRDPAPTASGCRMHCAVSQKNHFVTADEGVARVESDFATARYAGMPRGLGMHPNGPIVLPGAGRPFADGQSRAYRVTWHRKDADGVELGGAPTARWIITNSVYVGGYTGAVASFGMYIHLPSEFGTLATALTTTYFWRLWGTRTFVEATEQGDDEMHLLTEQYISAADLAAGNVNFVDAVPDSYLLSSPTLHTNLYNFPFGESGIRQGVANEDAPPPRANDVASWRDVLWYADITQRANLLVSMVSAPADNDTVSINANGVNVVLRAKLAPALATDFLIAVAGPTAAINLRLTAINLASKVKQHCAANGLGCYHVSTSATEPALLYFEQSQLSAGNIAFVPSAPTRWHGFDGFDLATAVAPRTGTNELWFSKPGRGDAVPPVNRLSVGTADNRILRIQPFVDRLLVFSDQGIFEVTGKTFADFGVYEFDLGYRLMGRELVAMCDEKVYAWCNEGMVECDDGGVTVVSTPIEPTIEGLLVTIGGAVAEPLDVGRAGVALVGFATAYRNQHQVRFHYPYAFTTALAYASTAWLSFDTRTRAWARGDFGTKQINGYYDGRAAGVVRFADDLLVTGSWSSGADTFLFLERRAYVAADFTDDDRTGGTSATRSLLVFQWQVPDEEGAQHWQQTVINWDAEELAWRPLPSSIQTVHTTETDTASQTVAVSELVTRIEPPQATRRGQRMQVTLLHEIAEYVGIVGVSQAYRSGSKFARRVTP